MYRTTAAALLLALVLSGCGSDAGGGRSSAGTEGGTSGGGGEATMGFGQPAEPEEADRSIDIAALDELEFDPPALTVEEGETIAFVVTNEGKAPHEFVIGDRQYQDEHERAMGHGGHGASIDNVIELEPGETAEIAWTFSEAGEVLYGCHVSGHYAGGMVGTVTVEER